MCVALVVFGLAALDYVPKYGIPIYPFGYVFALAFALIVTYAIVKHHVMDINLVFQRGLIYSVLVAGITVVYLAFVLLAEKLFQGMVGYQGLIATLLAAVTIAIGFIPFKNAAQRIIDRRFFQGTQLELARQRERLLLEIRKSDQVKAVATLAAGLAHEIKNPLTAIKTFTEYLDSRYHDPVYREKFQRIVGGEVAKIQRIVQELLDFARPSPLQFTAVEVPRLLDETLEGLTSELLLRRIEVIRCYEDSAPVLGDAQQLKQVFLNLFLNSLQAMDKGGGRLVVQTAREGSRLVVSVADTGCGISPEHLAKLFEPFFTTKANGNGLGLAVVQGIIKDPGGAIRIDSQPGQGTRIRTELPLYERESPMVVAAEGTVAPRTALPLTTGLPS